MLLLRLSLVLVAGALCAQDPIEYTDQEIYDGQNGHRFQPTVRQECRSVVFASDGTTYTGGIQSNATDLLNSTRQFVSLGRWRGDHWSEIAKVNELDGYVYSSVAAADNAGGLRIASSEFDELEQGFNI